MGAELPSLISRVLLKRTKPLELLRACRGSSSLNYCLNSLLTIRTLLAVDFELSAYFELELYHLGLLARSQMYRGTR